MNTHYIRLKLNLSRIEVLSAEGAPGDADLIDICQTDSESANPEGMPIEDAAQHPGSTGIPDRIGH